MIGIIVINKPIIYRKRGDILNIDYIVNRFKGREGKPMGIEQSYSVLLPLVLIDNEWHILFEIRSNTLETQPGEISFPGGAVEENESTMAAAIRETHEELNINPNNIKVIGELDYLYSPYNMMIYGYVGILKDINPKCIQFNKQEVAHIFTVPVKFFVDNEPLLYHVSLEVSEDNAFPYHLIPDGKDYKWRKAKNPVFFYVYKNYIIWGLTARVIKNFVDILNEDEKL